MTATEALQKIFKEECVNVSAFAKKNSISYSALQQILHGRTLPHHMQTRLFKRIADGLGMTMDELYAALGPEEQD